MGDHKPIAAPGDTVWYLEPLVRDRKCSLCGAPGPEEDAYGWMVYSDEIERICWDKDSLTYDMACPDPEAWGPTRPAADVFLTEAEAEAEAVRRSDERFKRVRGG